MSIDTVDKTIDCNQEAQQLIVEAFCVRRNCERFHSLSQVAAFFGFPTLWLLVNAARHPWHSLLAQLVMIGTASCLGLVSISVFSTEIFLELRKVRIMKQAVRSLAHQASTLDSNKDIEDALCVLNWTLDYEDRCNLGVNILPSMERLASFPGVKLRSNTVGSLCTVLKYAANPRQGYPPKSFTIQVINLIKAAEATAALQAVERVAQSSEDSEVRELAADCGSSLRDAQNRHLSDEQLVRPSQPQTDNRPEELMRASGPTARRGPVFCKSRSREPERRRSDRR